MQLRPVVCFILINALLSLAAFRNALWGKALLAPLDLPAAAYSKYRFLNPDTTGIAANYGLNDQLLYDLPIQYTIHDAYRRGEIPWWDPYSFAGRPLLADPHCNGMDPVRVTMDILLPFELAYNWTRILDLFLSGLGVFLLLRKWGFSFSICLLLACTYEFCGFYSFFYAYSWLLGSFVYYPFLWLVWDSATRRRRWWHLPAAALLVAGIFYSGSLQTHTYLVIFAAAFCLGYARSCPEGRKTLLAGIVFSCALGACLAAPALMNQVEYFLLSVRTPTLSNNPRAWLSGLASLSCVFPWALGAPGTLDLRNYFFRDIGLGQNYGLGFQTYIGSAGFFLALLGAIKGNRTENTPARRTAIWLIAFVFAILSSPLLTIFYSRSTGLAVLGLIVLAAMGCEFLNFQKERLPVWGRSVLGTAILIAIALNVGSLVIYPRLLPQIRKMVQAREDSMEFKIGPSMRDSQLENFPRQISFRNPAALLAFLSLVALAALFLSPRAKKVPLASEFVLAVNFLPVLLLFLSMAPCHPVGLWRRLLKGGPEQQKVMAAVCPDRLRLLEIAPGLNDYLFPDGLEHLYRVRTVHGYSPLVLQCLLTLTPEEQQRHRNQLADYVYQSTNRNQAAGNLIKADIPARARFQWVEQSDRSITIEQETLNSIRLSIGPGPAGTLLWTDTHYPGWTATIDGKSTTLLFSPPCFGRIELPPGTTSLVLNYKPRFLKAGILTAIAGLLLSGVFGYFHWIGFKKGG